MLEDERYKKDLKFVEDTKKIFIKTYNELERKINTWFKRLADNNGISTQEAKRLLSSNELKEFKWTLEEYIEKGRANAVNQQWIKQLENASARVHISKLVQMQIELRAEIEEFAAEYNNVLTEFIESEIYTEQFYMTAFNVAVGTNIGVAMDVVDTVKLKQLINKPWAPDGYTFSERIWRDKEKFINKLQLQLSQSLALGEGPEKTVSALYTDFKSENSKYQLRRVVMTESAFFASTAQGDAFKELDVEHYEILATLDSRTSKICQELDGDIFDMKEYQVGATAPPFHPFCRSVTMPYFDDDDDYSERIARDRDGEVFYVPGNMKYDEWKEKFLK